MPLAPQQVRTFFITSVTASRRRLFQTEAAANLLVDVLQSNRKQGRLLLHTYVIMPDHMHLILTPASDVSLEKAMQFIKGGFSFQLKSKRDVWERSFKEHRIADGIDYHYHAAYIEQNPVRAHLVETASAFPFSNAHHPELIDPPPLHFFP